MTRIMFVVFMVQAMLLTGCMSSNQQSAEDFIKEVKQEKSDKIPALPEVQEYKSVDYDVSSKRSPFQPSPEFLTNTDSDKKPEDALVATQQPRPDADRRRELLENYSLDSINMVGVIKKGKTYWAIVKDKTGVIHRVHVGNYLGENSGCIEKITDQTIFVKETIADGQGGWVERSSSLSLAK